jgi:predicted lipoprotein
MTSPAPISTASEAESLAANAVEVMEALVGLLKQETELVRAGRLSEAAKLAEPKAALARRYVADTLSLRSNQAKLSRLLAAEKLAALRQQLEMFQSLLQTNLTVLATAHAVSEGIIRGVSGELARKSAPQTYGASGRTVAPPRSAGQPLAVSRML